MADYAKMIKELEDGLSNGQFSTDAQKKTANDMISSFKKISGTSGTAQSIDNAKKTLEIPQNYGSGSPTETLKGYKPAQGTIFNPALPSGQITTAPQFSAQGTGTTSKKVQAVNQANAIAAANAQKPTAPTPIVPTQNAAVKPVLLERTNVTTPFGGPSEKANTQTQGYTMDSPIKTALDKLATQTPQEIQQGVKDVGQRINQMTTGNLVSSKNVTVKPIAGPIRYAPETKTVQLDNPQGAAGYDELYAQLQKQIQDALNQPSQSYEDIYQSIMDQLPEDVRPSVLSWTDAVAQAQQNINPLYDESVKNLGKSLDINNLRSGFYGQKPGDAYKAERLSSEENARLQAINGLASQLQGLSQQQAQDAINTNMSRQQQALQTLNMAMNSSQSQKNQSLQNLWNMVNLARSDKTDAKEEQWREEDRTTDESRYQDSLTNWGKERMDKLGQWAIDNGWKQTEWDQHIKESDKANTWAEKEWAANEPVRKAQLEGYQIDNRIKRLELDNLPTKIQGELNKLKADLEGATSQSEYEAILNDLTLAIKATELDTATQKLEDIIKKSPDGKGMAYQDYLNYMQKMANETVTVVEIDPQTYMPITTTKPKYTWDELVGIINGSDINPAWKQSLLNNTGAAWMQTGGKAKTPMGPINKASEHIGNMIR